MAQKNSTGSKKKALNALTESGQNGSVGGPLTGAGLRLSQDFKEETGARKILQIVPVRKPSRDDFFRVRPGSEWRETVAIIELKDDRETFAVTPDFVKELSPGEYKRVILRQAINRQGVTFLIPVRLPRADARFDNWGSSMTFAVDLAERKWVRVYSNMSLGAYETTRAFRIQFVELSRSMGFESR